MDVLASYAADPNYTDKILTGFGGNAEEEASEQEEENDEG